MVARSDCPSFQGIALLKRFLRLITIMQKPNMRTGWFLLLADFCLFPCAIWTVRGQHSFLIVLLTVNLVYSFLWEAPYIKYAPTSFTIWQTFAFSIALYVKQFYLRMFITSPDPKCLQTPYTKNWAFSWLICCGQIGDASISKASVSHTSSYVQFDV